MHIPVTLCSSSHASSTSHSFPRPNLSVTQPPTIHLHRDPYMKVAVKTLAISATDALALLHRIGPLTPPAKSKSSCKSA